MFAAASHNQKDGAPSDESNPSPVHHRRGDSNDTNQSQLTGTTFPRRLSQPSQSHHSAQPPEEYYGSNRATDPEIAGEVFIQHGADGMPLWDSGMCCPKGLQKELTMRQVIFLTMDDPASSVLARVISVFVLFFIFLSTTSFILETMPELRHISPDLWYSIEVISITVFTIEYATRISTCPKLLVFLTGAMNIIDFLAIIPFYIDLFVMVVVGNNLPVGLQFLRVMRVARVFRVMKISKYSSAMQLFGTAMKQAVGGLYLLLVYLFMAVIIFSSVIHFCERGTWDDERDIWVRDDGTPSPYYSIPASAYWSVVTMTTVGYGDNVPVTTLGKIVAMLCMMMGILIIALPTSTIGSKFQQVMEEQRTGVATDSSSTMMYTTVEWENQRKELEQYLVTFELLVKKIRQKTHLMDQMYLEQMTEKLDLEKHLEELQASIEPTEGKDADAAMYGSRHSLRPEAHMGEGGGGRRNGGTSPAVRNTSPEGLQEAPIPVVIRDNYTRGGLNHVSEVSNYSDAYTVDDV